MIGPGLSAFQLSYTVSPIILTGGVAKDLPGGMLPLINITEPNGYSTGALAQGDSSNLDDFFAHYVPLAGATLIDNQIGTYPFANQSTAANAIITQPLKISMMMICPVKDQGGYQTKTQIFAAMKKTLDQHNGLAGTYTVATPSFLYTNCIMTGFRDASTGESKQAQNQWQLDFSQPLLTLEAATAAMNLQMSKMSSGLAIPGDPPRATATGVVDSNVATSTVPSSQTIAGSNAGSVGANPLSGPSQ